MSSSGPVIFAAYSAMADGLAPEAQKEVIDYSLAIKDEVFDIIDRGWPEDRALAVVAVYAAAHVMKITALSPELQKMVDQTLCTMGILKPSSPDDEKGKEVPL